MMVFDVDIKLTQEASKQADGRRGVNLLNNKA
jgi:hypothetical protein